MIKSDMIDALAGALAIAQGQIQDAKKDANNPFFKSKYADLAGIWAVCRKPLSENGLSIIQTVDVRDGKRYLDSTLLHASGQFITSSLELVIKEESMHALGSAITYARRYQLASMVGVCADEDDDGEAAVGRVEQKYNAKVTKVEEKQTDHICPLHNVPLKEYSNAKGKWWAHKVEGTDDWCDGVQVKPAKPKLAV